MSDVYVEFPPPPDAVIYMLQADIGADVEDAEYLASTAALRHLPLDAMAERRRVSNAAWDALRDVGELTWRVADRASSVLVSGEGQGYAEALAEYREATAKVERAIERVEGLA